MTTREFEVGSEDNKPVGRDEAMSDHKFEIGDTVILTRKYDENPKDLSLTAVVAGFGTLHGQMLELHFEEGALSGGHDCSGNVPSGCGWNVPTSVVKLVSKGNLSKEETEIMEKGSYVEINSKDEHNSTINGTKGYICCYYSHMRRYGVALVKETSPDKEAFESLDYYSCGDKCSAAAGRYFEGKELKLIDKPLSFRQLLGVKIKEDDKEIIHFYSFWGYNFFNDDGDYLLFIGGPEVSRGIENGELISHKNYAEGKYIRLSHGDLLKSLAVENQEEAKVGDKVVCLIKNKFAEKGTTGSIIYIDRESDMCAVQWDRDVGGSDLDFLGIKECPDGHGEITLFDNIATIN